MTFEFGITDDHKPLRDGFRDLLGAVMSDARRRQLLEQTTFDREIWREVSAGGWLEAGITDGDDSGPLLVHLGEQVGAYLLPGPFSLVASMVVPTLLEFSDSGLPFDYDSVTSGEVVATILCPSGGSPTDPEWRQFTLSEEAGGVRLSGRATGVPIGHLADWVLVPITRDDGSVTIVLLEGMTPGIDREQDGELDFSRPAGVIAVDDLLIDGALLLGGSDADHRAALTACLQRYLLCLDAESVGGAEAALKQTVTYTSERRQFGVPVGSFQAVKHLLADAWAKIEVARSLTHHTAWALGHDPEAARDGVIGSRILAADMFPAVVETCIQCHGGAGFTWELGLHGWYRQALYHRHHPFSPDRLREILYGELIAQVPSAVTVGVSAVDAG
jgi:acyl-CoA dehydrogenase